MSAEELMKLYSRENHEKVKDVKESVPDKEKIQKLWFGLKQKDKIYG